jgi:tRNA uridine 5-carboxymethylaminomethyl modification enzyme
MEKDYYNYDVIVIGGGLSGCTAASTSAGAGAKTLLITINMDSPASMQFGNIFHKEKITGILACMDKQGSRMPGIIKDSTLIETGRHKQETKGLYNRLIADRKRFSLKIKEMLESQDNLHTRQGLATDILLGKNRLIMSTSDRLKIYARSIVLCTGTSLDARISWGKNIIEAGRPGEIHSSRLYKNLIKKGIRFRAAANMAAPRIHGSAINKESRNIKAAGNGEIKLYRAVDAGENKEGLWLIPEGRKTGEMYVWGFENALDEEQQLKRLRRIEGLENIYLARPGYRIEYACLEPSGIDGGMDAAGIKGLFFAGRVTGINSYEDSIRQGFLAGINASRASADKKTLLPEELIKKYC